MAMILFVTPVLYVALLAEGVDRNTPLKQNKPGERKVALLAEGVDRNPLPNNIIQNVKSPSSRRAWIEM